MTTTQSADAWIFDFDNHYYESEDAFTRHQDAALRNRGIRWAEIDGRRRLLVGGTVNSYTVNPTFDPVARPGSLYDWYRGNPKEQSIVEAFGDLEPIRPEYRDRDARLQVMDDQRVAGTLLFPTLGVGIEDALRHDAEAAAKAFHAFNLWLDEDWGYAYEGRIFAVPYIQMLDPQAAAVELRAVLDKGAVAPLKEKPVAAPAKSQLGATAVITHPSSPPPRPRAQAVTTLLKWKKRRIPDSPDGHGIRA